MKKGFIFLICLSLFSSVFGYISKSEGSQCPKIQCPVGSFMGDDGKCYNCDTEESVAVNCLQRDAAEEACPNRVTYYCVNRLLSEKCQDGSEPVKKNGLGLDGCCLNKQLGIVDCFGGCIN